MIFEPKLPRFFKKRKQYRSKADAVHKVDIERRKLYTASVFSFLLSTVSLSEENSYCLPKVEFKIHTLSRKLHISQG